MLPNTLAKIGRRVLDGAIAPAAVNAGAGGSGSPVHTSGRPPAGMPDGRAPSSLVTSAQGRPRVDLSAMARKGDRTVHTMAAGTLQRFNDPGELEKFLHDYDESMMISTFDSEEDVRKHNPQFAEALERSKEQFALRGLKLEVAFGVDLTKTGQDSAAVARMHERARASAIDMSRAELRFPRSNEATPEADRRFLQDMAAAQAAQGVCELVVRHTIDSPAAHGAPDGPMIDEALLPHFQLESREKERDTAIFESSPMSGGDRATGHIVNLNKSTYSRS